MQLRVPEQADGAVHAVVAGLPDHFLPAQTGDRLGEEGRRGGPDVFERQRVEKRELRPEPAEEALVVPGDPLALRADLMDLGQDLGQRDQALHRARGRGRRGLLRPIGEIFDPVHDAHRQRLAAHRAQALALPGLARREADFAVAVAVQMILPLLGKELQRPPVPLARLQCRAQREVIHRGVEHAHLPPQLLRRMGVRVGNQPETVQGRDPPVHGRIRRQPGLDREDVRREVSVAVVDGVEARLRAERGEPRRPDMGGDEVRVRSRLQGDLQQVPGVEPQDRPPVRVQVADPGQAVHYPVRRIEIRGVDQVVDLPRPVELLVDGRDLDREHEPHGGPLAPARGRQTFLDRPFQIRPQAEQSRLRRHELLLQLRPPRRMREVPGGDDADPLLAGPQGQVLEVAVPARRSRVLRMHVQVGVERHAAALPAAVSSTRPDRPRPRTERRGPGVSLNVNPSWPLAATSSHLRAQEGTHGYDMNTRGLPGTFVPRYHELHEG